MFRTDLSTLRILNGSIAASLLTLTLVLTACGKPPSIVYDATGTGIVNGDPVATPGSGAGGRAAKNEPLANSIVALVMQSDDHQGLCTGTLLAKDLVLTAAHCVEPMNPGHPEQMYVIFGTNMKTAGSQRALVRSVDHAAQNPAWGKSDKNGRGDLALVHFNGGLPDGFSPVQLTDGKIDLQAGSHVLMIGYGVTNGLTHAGAGVLRETETTVLSQLSPTEIITDGHKSSVCFGDSGGPAFVQENGRWVQWGVASSVTNDACNESSVHTSVVSYLPWLHKTAARLRR